MRFSDIFGVRRTADDTWFDPFLTIDTKLFIDPFLIYIFGREEFNKAHDDVISFFNMVFLIIAKSTGNEKSPSWRRAEALLSFPEASELCLGYTSEGTGGAGSGRGYATRMARGLWKAVERGKTQIEHFEEIQIFEEGIGADRISDATLKILRSRFVKYTQSVCDHHNIPTESFHYDEGVFSNKFERWVPETFRLPKNPYTGSPIILTPQNFLRRLPTINPDDFWDYCYTNENETLRLQYSADITKNVDKPTIIDFAEKYSSIAEKFIKETEKSGSQPYDFVNDPAGLVSWYEESKAYVLKRPRAINFKDRTEFIAFLDVFTDEFRRYVEDNSGYKLLWNDDRTNKSEEACQLLFLGIVKHYCHANDIDISREANIGRGPVDFKASQGVSKRALIELKLAKNTKFWDGLRNQLPQYMRSEGVDIGYFVVIAFRDQDAPRTQRVAELAREVARTERSMIQIVNVDARRDQPRASCLKAETAFKLNEALPL